MKTPGFAAEASLSQTKGHYYTARIGIPVGGAIHPAASVNWNCYNECHAWCGPDCSDFTGAKKGACLRNCAAACRADCAVA